MVAIDGSLRLISGVRLGAALLAFTAWSLSPATGAPGQSEGKAQISAESLARKVAMRYGLEAFPGVKTIHWVFNVTAGKKDVSRDWTWYPQEDSVLYKGEDAAGAPISAAYSRKNGISMASEQVKSVDKMFINDQYWLLFPLHLAWDSGTTMSVSKMPAKGRKTGETYKLTISYPQQGGYTPGDAYDLMVDSSGMVHRWMFRKGNAGKPTTEATWSEPVPVGGLNLSMDRPGTKGPFKVWFTDVRVE